MKPIYLDYAATTPVDPRVVESMLQYLGVDSHYGNPASRSHAYGWEAEEAVEAARVQVARLIHCDPREIVWTSGATESDNLALKGVIASKTNAHIITSAIEHKAVLDTCAYLETLGHTVTYLRPNAEGLISCEQLLQAITPETVLVSLMHVNNEIGVMNDVSAFGEICRERDIIFHVDAAQSVGKVPVDIKAMKIDLLSLSAHKFYGPKGMGALYVRREPPIKITPLIHGGGHEWGMRSGTLATHQIVGLGKAAALAEIELASEMHSICGLRDRLSAHLRQLPGTQVNGHLTQSAPGILNVSFAGVDGETLLMSLDEVAVSNGSACTSAAVEPSYVLTALGVSDDLAHSALRFSIGRFTSEEDIDFAAKRVVEIVSRLRETRV